MMRAFIALLALTVVALVACGGDASNGDFPLIDATVSDAPYTPDTGSDADADLGDQPACVDTESDGLCDELEEELGTDSDKADTDGDGYWDGWEHAAGTDPLDPEDHPTYELPAGDSYALQVTEFVEPENIAGLVSGRLDEAPPVLLFADGLSDGQADARVDLVGGLGELISWGPDETPETDDDVYAMAHYSIKQTDGEFIVELDGQADALELSATAETIVLDLSGFSSATEGLVLQVSDVEVRGTLTSDLYAIDDMTLAGRVSDEGLDDLLEALKDRLPIEKEQALRLLDPDGDGIIPVELGLAGHQVIVDGFTDPADDRRSEPREAQECCPAGLALGDPIYPYLSWQDQGIQDDEFEVYQLAISQLEQDPDVALFATARSDAATEEIVYSVFNGGAMPAGHIEYRRVAGDNGQRAGYEILSQTGDNPLANNDPMALGTYEALLAAGQNPSGTDYLQKDYGAGDERVVFVPVEEMHYAFGMERLAQIFDDPRAGDMVVLPASWATGGFGNHGHLNNLQSRSPLIVAGPGIRTAAEGNSPGATAEPLAGSDPGLLLDEVARVVDIAPTLAAALGVAPTTGVGPDGRLSDDVYLSWQDGQVLEGLFTAEALQTIADGQPVAQHAVIIVNDGLTSTEILYQALADASEGFAVDQYRRLMSRGATYRFGSITNYPSNTYPSHNALGAGAWSGHHGIIDNYFWAREVGVAEQPIQEIFDTEYLFGSAHPGLPVETLHEAVARSFGESALTTSINDPSTRGAPLSTLERRFPDGFELPDASDTVQIGGVDYALPDADIADYAGVLDNASAQAFASVYTHDVLSLPKYTIVNFGSTDTAGHAYGPHGDQERHVVIGRVNERLKIIFAALEDAGILDQTLIVLTSDHGMELQDAHRMGSRLDGLADVATPVRYRSEGKFVYFKLLDTEVVDNQLAAGQTTSVTLRVFDSDTRWGDETLPASGVVARVVDGGTAQPVATDAEGLVTLDVDVDEGVEDVLVEVGGDEWTVHRVRVSVP